MGAFSRFAPVVSDSLPFLNDSVLYEAELNISKSNIAYKLTQNYEHFSMYYGNAKSDVDMQLLVKGEVYLSKTLPKNLNYGVVECDLPDSVITSYSIHYTKLYDNLSK